jgi:hypothetical protein
MATAAGTISNLESAGFSKGAATSFVSDLPGFSGSPGRMHFMDEPDAFDPVNLRDEAKGNPEPMNG